MDYFLGLDCSTQSFSGILIDFQEKKTLFSHSINFDVNLPQYGTQHGVYTSNDGKVVHSNPLMWVEALELLFAIFLQEGLPLNDIKLITGSGQQHGTVYLNKSFEPTVKNLNNEKSLVSQIKGTFSRETSPVWMDSSTTKECEEIRNQLGGLKSTIQITGSNTFERFSGPQIRKFYKDNHDDYSQTSVIHLVSSFLSSVLLGKNSPIDHSDGAGMNLMNIKTKEWDNRALDSTAPDLKKKLPPLTNPYSIIGKIAPFFVDRYGFSSETLLIPWSGDNPSSLIGVGLTEKGKAAISLGTSDTFFTYLKDLFVDLSGEGHVFGAPTGDYMGLICYKNGSLAREKVKDSFNLNWTDFSNILAKTPPGNYGKIMLPYFFPEIVPLVSKPKVHRFGFDENDLEGNVRAVIEAQFLSMKIHSEWTQEPPEEIYATGGASTNLEILKIVANIFNTKVRQFEATNSAALGAALRSAKSYYNLKNQIFDWTELVEGFLKIEESIIIHPNKKYELLYNDMLTIYQKYEDYILRNGEDPELFRQNFIKKYFKNQRDNQS
ncbi:MAG TPA: FGGY family carbohydrate kinase [Candidatus Nanopelagicaceae bacterium]|nr:FGGY family carbohydrate kinase [Candidatus Nanopelagicaceae bacterium]